MTRDDRSIHISGHAGISGSQIGSGENVTQTQNLGAAPQPGSIEDSLATVAELLDRHAAELTEPGRARRDLGDLREESAEEEPDPDRLAHALERLSGRVGGVAVLAAAVRQLAAQLGLG